MERWMNKNPKMLLSCGAAWDAVPEFVLVQ
jgi:hypothetical protein